MACGENSYEDNEVDKLTIQMEQIQTAIQELTIAKQKTEAKLREEIEKVKTKQARPSHLDRNSSQTATLLDHMSIMYDEMFCMHQNCELNDKSEVALQSYRNEFEQLLCISEKLERGFLKAPKQRFGCPCQMTAEEYKEFNDESVPNVERSSIILHQSSYETYPNKKCTCPTDMDESELDEEEDEEDLDVDG